MRGKEISIYRRVGEVHARHLVRSFDFCFIVDVSSSREAASRADRGFVLAAAVM